MRAPLAERDDGYAAALFGVVAVLQFYLAFVVRGLQQKAKRMADGRVGKVGERAHDGHVVPFAFEVGGGGEGGDLALGGAQGLHDAGRIGGICDTFLCLFHHVFEGFSGGFRAGKGAKRREIGAVARNEALPAVCAVFLAVLWKMAGQRDIPILLQQRYTISPAER